MSQRPASPYADLPPDAFWRSGVVEAEDIFAGLYRPKVKLTAGDAVMTAGSCFAQHISRALRRAGLKLVDTERIESAHLSEEVQNRFGYGLYSARYGNIYTTRQFRQLLEEAHGAFTPADAVWERDGRYFDALRPNVEPDGHDSAEEVAVMRQAHLKAVCKAVAQADVLVFTLGLTEAWEHRASGTVYPTAPGTVAGHYDPEKHGFRNFTFSEVVEDFLAVRQLMRALRPGLRIILTVSPVPLTATASGAHVAVATSRSKAVLRAAAAELSAAHDDIDYFPSYEMVTHPRLASEGFADNLRSPRSEVVQAVIETFLNAHGLAAGTSAEIGAVEDDPICEDVLLEAFAR